MTIRQLGRKASVLFCVCLWLLASGCGSQASSGAPPAPRQEAPAPKQETAASKQATAAPEAKDAAALQTDRITCYLFTQAGHTVIDFSEGQTVYSIIMNADRETAAAFAQTIQ